MKMLLAACLALACMTLYAQDKMDCPMHQSAADQHAADVDMRGDHAMGFSHETTKHHFELLPDGGIIQVDANSETDATTRDEIRQHLTHIAAMFSANNFEIPMFIHDTVPPGVPVMKERHGAIKYTFKQTPRGAMVRIVTHDPAALKAVHAFLAFQIQDHRTGDPAAVAKPS
jgi:hypothetical protein